MFSKLKDKLTKNVVFRGTAIILLNFLFYSKTIKSWFEEKIFNPYIIDKDGDMDYAEAQLKSILDSFDIRDKTILELGPGGSYRLGCLLLGNGAKKIFVIDSENHNFCSQKELNIYREIYPKSVKDGRINPEKIEILNYNKEGNIPLSSESVDIIYSCAVFEHVFEPQKLLNNCQEILKKGGSMYHQIDLRDHVFSQKSLFFLKIPDFLFDMLFKNTGMWVNRLRYSEWIKIFSDLKNMKIIETKEVTGEISLDEDLKVISLLVILKKYE